MNCRVVFLLIGTLVAICQSATDISDRQSCRFRQKGDTYQLRRECGRCICEGGFGSGAARCETCGIASLRPTKDLKRKGCFIQKPNASEDYPACCTPEIICPHDHSDSSSSSSKDDDADFVGGLRRIILIADKLKRIYKNHH